MKKRFLSVLLMFSLIIALIPVRNNMVSAEILLSSENAYLTFSGEEEFTLNICNNSKNWDGVLEYSTDLNNWTEWDGTKLLSYEGKIYLRGRDNSYISVSNNYRFVLDGTNISCSGNIESLLDYEIVEQGEHPQIGQNAFTGLFYDNLALVSAPELPATILADYCYTNMFSGCKNLTQAPELNATELAEFCYANMFADCESLIKAPVLPAEIMKRSCYSGMFSNCTNLTEAPELPATTLETGCYSAMFLGCTSLEKAPELRATILADSCYSSMFQGCTSLTKLPSLPAIILTDSCYSHMFDGCINLKAVPSLPATTLADYCYYSMFSGCKNIKLSETKTEEHKYKWSLPNDAVTAANCCINMFMETGGTYYGYPEFGKVYYMTEPMPVPVGEYIAFSSADEFKLKTYNNSKNWNGKVEYSTDTKVWSEWDGKEISSADGILYLRGKENSNISSLTDSSFVLTGIDIYSWGNIENLLDYETVKQGNHPSMEFKAFYALFYNNEELVSAPSLPATELAGYCYDSMFYGCMGLKEAPELPATNLAISCYGYMFHGCASLTEPPILSATNLTDYCYSYMFKDCTSLAVIPQLPSYVLAEGCYTAMFQGCTSLTVLPELPATELKNACYNMMFYGCTGIKLSDTKTAEYQCEWSIPKEAVSAMNWNMNMLSKTGGTFTDNPEINKVYYMTVPDIKIENHSVIVIGYENDCNYNYQFRMTSPKLVTGTFIVSLYDSQNRLIEIKTIKMKNADAAYTVPSTFINTTAQVDTYKIMFWSDTNELKPLCDFVAGDVVA